MDFRILFICDCGCHDGIILVDEDAVRVECKECYEQYDIGCHGDMI